MLLKTKPSRHRIVPPLKQIQFVWQVKRNCRNIGTWCCRCRWLCCFTRTRSRLIGFFKRFHVDDSDAQWQWKRKPNWQNHIHPRIVPRAPPPFGISSTASQPSTSTRPLFTWRGVCGMWKIGESWLIKLNFHFVSLSMDMSLFAYESPFDSSLHKNSLSNDQ